MSSENSNHVNGHNNNNIQYESQQQPQQAVQQPLQHAANHSSHHDSKQQHPPQQRRAANNNTNNHRNDHRGSGGGHSSRQPHRSSGNSRRSHHPRKYVSQILYFPPSQFSLRFGTQFYTVEIPECRVVYDKETESKFAVYKFQVKRGRQTREIFYRYSEIRQLHEYLCSTSTSVGSVANACSFPNKTWFKSLDDKFLDKRRLLLQTYFHQLLSSSRSISHIPCIKKFLQLDQFVVKEWWKE